MDIKELGLTDEQVSGVQKLIQSAEDKVRTDYSQKLKDANLELAKYKPAEKTEAEIALEKRVASLEQREKELADKERAVTLSTKLREKGLPSELAGYLNVGDDIDEAIESVGAVLGNYFLDSSNKPAAHNKNEGVTKEQFRKMSYNERSKLFQDNPELFKALSK